MYIEFFGLNEKPFSITPDPRYLYLTGRHADALAHLVYGISESGGFIQLTGEVGTGKTTLIRSLLEQMPTGAKVAVILNPNLTAREFLAAICIELQIALPQHDSKSALIGALNHYLLTAHAQGTRVVLIVDEAQTLDAELLEQVRLLTNLETSRQKLLQIILIGQPELRDLLHRPDMRQVAQRITGRFHLEPLSRRETSAYVTHRMKVAGSHGEVFTRSAMRALFRQSSGIPRLINVVADRALLAGFVLDSPKVNGKLVRRAASEVFGRPQRRWWPYPVFVALVAAIGLYWWQLSPLGEQPEPAKPVESIEPGDSARLDVAVDAPSAIAEIELGTEAGKAASTARKDDFAEAVFDTGDGGSETAYRALLRAWGVSVEPEIGPSCAQAVVQQLSCVFIADAPITRLETIAKPVVVSLESRTGDKRDVLLDGLDDHLVRLSIGEHHWSVARHDFEPLWNGSYVAVWRPVRESQAVLRLGSQGEDVIWLRKALASIYGRELSEPDLTDEFDSSLDSLVREYQRDRALRIDGVVGRETQGALNDDLGMVTASLVGRRG